MWRCYRCETFNNSKSCFICGLPQNAPLPVKDTEKIPPKTEKRESALFVNIDDNEKVDVPEKEQDGMKAFWIIVFVLFMVLILFLFLNGYI